MGLADASPYSVRPALLAPVLLADALNSGSRVRLDVDRALNVLLERAGLGAGQDADSARDHLVFGGTRLGPQLNTLAQAAHDLADNAIGTRLAQVVRGLLTDDADVGAWAAVARLSGEVAVAAPDILAKLHALLVRRWPLTPSPQLWGGDPAAHYRHELLGLGEGFATLAQRVGLAAVPSPVSIVLDVAWLMDPALPADGSQRDNGILRAIRQWCSAPAHVLPTGFDALFEQRSEVLRAINQWRRDRTASAPQGLDTREATARGPVALARVLLAAVQPLLLLTVESTSSSPEAANTITLHATVLPDRPETLTLLRDALALLVPLLDEPTLYSGEGLPLLHTLVSLPEQLRNESARPMAFSGAPLPEHAVTALDTAAAEFTEQIAVRWDSLPLSVRRSAAQAVLGPEPRPLTLNDAAAAGDGVAVAAQADTALARLLVLQPLRDRTGWRQAMEKQHKAASRLGAEMDLPEALVLLDETGSNVTGLAVAALPAFAQAVGAAADDPQPALDRIDRAPLAGEEALLAGLARRHPDVVWPWLLERARDPRLARAAVACADEHPEREPGLLAQILESISAQSAANSEAASWLTKIVNGHLIPCKQPLAQRMKVAASLASCCPADAVPSTIQFIGFLLQEAHRDSIPVEAALAGKFGDALRRRLREADEISGTLHYDEDTAYGAAVIASCLPEEIATVAVERLLATDGRYDLPIAWRRSFERLTPPEREDLVSAFLQQMDAARASGDVSDRVELRAARLVSALGAGTQAWADCVRQWASGSPAQRERAAAAIHHTWHNPLWAEIVSTLLTAGIDADSRNALLADIVLPELTRDLSHELQPRRAVLASLQSDTNAAVHAFASEALHRIDALGRRPPTGSRLQPRIPPLTVAWDVTLVSTTTWGAAPAVSAAPGSISMHANAQRRPMCRSEEDRSKRMAWRS